MWELELGHTVTPAQGLPGRIYPESFDDPAMLAGFVDAMRWGTVTSADPNRYLAPFWSGVNIEAYQLEPLRRALGAPRTNLLLADDVGLGKTIEAGLVIKELLLRHRARTAVIVSIGDDRDGQPDMIDRFRRSGLSHLPAVVGSERTSID